MNHERERAQKDAVRHRVPAIIDNLRASIGSLCERHAVRQLALFGSILRDDFDVASRSDVDMAVWFDVSPVGSLARQYFNFKQELESLLGRPVDLVEFEAMADTRLKRIIERDKVLIYGG